ncbi:MAG: lamin tail domain-containing protein [Chitinophagales bacterium]
MKNLLLSLIIFGFYTTYGQVMINEIAPTNPLQYMDEDGEYPDWIELYNTGAAPVSLEGYGITDNISTWNEWQFPDREIGAGERMMVFASGKNRNCMTCAAALIDHWETAIFDDDTWEYFVGTSAPDANWNNLLFAGTWSTGQGGFGFGDGDDNTAIITTARSVYYRKTFDVVDKTKLISAIVSMDYDDGFIAYLNGVEIARMNLTGTPNYNTFATTTHEATMYTGGVPETFEIDPAIITANLVDGENVIAFEVHNQSTGSSDMTGRSFLHFGILTADEFYFDNPVWFATGGTSENLHTNFKISSGETIVLSDAAGILIDSFTINNIQAGHASARIPDAAGWCITDAPTPNTVNSGTCYPGYASMPVIVTPVGFYTGTINAEIAGTNIYYTLDGSAPTEFSDDYLSPVFINSTAVLKARSFEAGKLPSAVATGSFLINEPTLLPVLSISGDPCDLFDEGAGCPAAYDDAIGWEPDNPQVPVTVEYFDASKTHRFTSDVRFEVCGNSSIAYNAQRSIEFTCDEEFKNTGDIEYNPFADDKPVLETIHGFRIRQQDQDANGARMKDVIANRMGLPTHNVSAGYQNVASFINGEYWGHYAAREELDQYFIADNFGCDADSIDLIRTGYGADVWYEVESGTDTAFFNLVDFITLNDMTDPVYYAAALEKIDMENWVDYYALQVFIENEEWLDLLENNIRIFKSYAPDMKWKYILWDLAFGQSCSNCNTLQGSLSNPHNSIYCDMFNAMLENPDFENYFINRFADLINYYFTAEITGNLIDENQDEIESEIAAQNSRWGTGSPTTWNNNVNNLKNFYSNRIPYQRDHIESYFNLDDQVDITINVNPPGAGFIKISTIIPQELPWTGVYFDGSPVTLTAIPNPGYSFVDWDDNIFIADVNAISFNNNFTSNTSFTANFTGTPISNPIIVSEINYNSDLSINSGDWVELHNTSAEEITITDYTFSSDLFYQKLQIPTGTIIPPYGYLVLVENADLFTTQHPGVTNYLGDFIFDLSNSGDTITLIDFSGNIISAFSFDDNKPWPVTADNFGRTMELTLATANPALATSWFNGCIGGSPGEPYAPCLENPIVSEINYHSSELEDAGDWFELHNYLATDFDISNWTVKDKNDNYFNVPAGTIINSNDYVVFYEDAAKFNAQFPSITNKVGPLNFGISNGNEVIRFYDGDGKLFQSVYYDNISPYPLSPDGGGTALQIIDVSADLNDPANWVASCPEGTPGTVYVTPCETLSVEDDINRQLFIYPNPANNFISFSIPTGEQDLTAIVVSDITGKIILMHHPAAGTEITIDISKLPSGIYQVQLLNTENKYSTSFIKQ